MSQLYLKIYILHISIWINAVIFSIQLNVIILYIMILIHRHCPQNLLQNLLAKSLEMILMVHEKLEKSSLRYSLELWMALLFTTYWKARVKNDTSYNSKMINDSIQKIAGILKENKIVIKPSGKKHIKVLIYKMLLMISKKKCE